MQGVKLRRNREVEVMWAQSVDQEMSRPRGSKDCVAGREKLWG